MKRIVSLMLFVFFIGSAFTSDIQYTYTPVFMTRETLNQSVSYVSEGFEMKKTGKIYYRAPYIYVNERYKGVHVINNTDPANPVNEGFIIAPGCIDMAVKDHILYLDNAVDLVSFDLDRKLVTKRIQNVFPEPVPSGGTYYHVPYNRPDGYIIVAWKKK